MVSPSHDEREQALRAVMQSLEHRKVETIAVTHRMALEARKAFQFALEVSPTARFSFGQK